MRILSILILTSLTLIGQDHPGEPVYIKYCAQCHGDEGDGQGYAHDFVLPRPRDFTTGVFKFRSTENGYLPTVEDLTRVVREGIHGTSMPAFAHIGEQEIKDVVDYIQVFWQDRREQDEEDGYWPPKVVPIGKPPQVTADMLATGREVYLNNGCADCHGAEGRADGPSSPTLEDDYGVPIKPANLTASWRFRGGGTMEDIYRAFSTGLSGTPMPTYLDTMTEAQRWAMTAFVHEMSPETAPVTSPRVLAKKVETLPTDPDDAAWLETEEAWFPLSAQIIWEPVNTNPTVFGVRVRALHDGSNIGLYLAWDDPTHSSTAITEAAASDDAEDDFWGDDSESEDDFWAEEEESDAGGDDDFWGEEEEASEAPEPITMTNDGFAVQFPSGLPKTNEKPYFVMGDGKSGVNLWRWQNTEPLGEVPFEGPADDPWAKYHNVFSGEPSFTNQIAKGRDSISDLEAGSPITGKVVYRQGTYHMVLTRKLAGDDPSEVQMVQGQFVPIAFWAWDGHNGEEGVKAALSSWYWLILEEPMPQSAWYKVALAMVITLLAQWLAVRAAKAAAARKKREPATAPEALPEPGVGK